MRVIFLKDCDKGKKGEAREVKTGYANNFLIPSKFALPETAKLVSFFKSMEKKKEKKSSKGEKKQTKMINNKIYKDLKGQLFKIYCNADSQGNLFGSVSPAIISKELLKFGYNVDSKYFKIDAPIKKIGKTEVSVELNKSNKFKILLEVLSL